MDYITLNCDYLNENLNDIKFIISYIKKYEIIKSIKKELYIDSVEEAILYYKNIEKCEYKLVIIFFEELYHDINNYKFYEKLQFIINKMTIEYNDNNKNFITLYSIFMNIYNKFISI